MDSNGRWLATNWVLKLLPPNGQKASWRKTKPYQPDEWGAVVREGCRILNENNWFPALTLILVAR